MEPECLFKLWLVVGNEEDGIDGEAGVSKDAGDCGPGEVVPLAGGAGVADGDDDGAGHGLIVDGRVVVAASLAGCGQAVVTG